jgi:hypothetical protein
MKKIFFMLALCVTVLSGFAQSNVPHRMLTFRNAPLGLVNALPVAPPGVKGNAYEENWQVADIYLTSEEKIENVQMRVNLKDYSLEIKHNGQIKILHHSRVASFSKRDIVGKNHFFVSAKAYQVTPVVLGYFEVIQDGEYALLQHTITDVVSGNYNTALDVGARDSEIVKHKEFYLAKNNLAVKVLSNKKKMLAAARETLQLELEKKIESLRINLKKEEDLIALIQDLNKEKI